MVMKDMKKIVIYHTHIEVSPYEQGDCPGLEKYLSKYDKVAHKYIPFLFYIENDILYLPRGISTNLLERFFNIEPVISYKYDEYGKIKKGKGLYAPKSDIQDEAIKFLTSTDKFMYSSRYSQLGLNLATGEGKTYSAICSALELKITTIVITHQDKIKQQWIDTIEEKTDLPNDRIINISGTDKIDMIMKDKLEGDIYLINHQTIQSYARTNSWSAVSDFFTKAKIGIKIIDESHKYFQNIFMIDNFTNTYKSFYLTGTFGRSDPMEVTLYKRAFASLARFEDIAMKKRRHTHFIICYIQSRAKGNKMPNLNTVYGFSKYKFIDYELNKSNGAMMRAVHKVLDETRNLNGKTLILTPKKSTVDYIAEEIEGRYGDKVGRIYSENSTSENEENKEKRYISSTISSSGVGADIKGLRVMLVLEPMSSSVLADQVQGRLREYSPDEDTYFFYFVDTTVKESLNTLKRVIPTMKKKCVDIISTKINL